MPPNQKVTSELPVLHVGSIPTFDPEKWDFEVEGSVEKPVRLTYKEFMDLPMRASMSDFHCVTGWTRLDDKWEGVSFKTIVDLVKPLNNAKYVTIEAESGYTTSLPLADLLEQDVTMTAEGHLVVSWDLDCSELPAMGTSHFVTPTLLEILGIVNVEAFIPFPAGGMAASWLPGGA